MERKQAERIMDSSGRSGLGVMGQHDGGGCRIPRTNLRTVVGHGDTPM